MNNVSRDLKNTLLTFISSGRPRDHTIATATNFIFSSVYLKQNHPFHLTMANSNKNTLCDNLCSPWHGWRESIWCQQSEHPCMLMIWLMHGEAMMCPDPEPDPASHTLNLACNDHLLEYLPVEGPGKSFAVAMVVDSDSSKGR